MCTYIYIYINMHVFLFGVPLAVAALGYRWLLLVAIQRGAAHWSTNPDVELLSSGSRSKQT